MQELRVMHVAIACKHAARYYQGAQKVGLVEPEPHHAHFTEWYHNINMHALIPCSYSVEQSNNNYSIAKTSVGLASPAPPSEPPLVDTCSIAACLHAITTCITCRLFQLHSLIL